MNNSDYVRALRPLLPAEALRPNPWTYVPIVIHLTVVFSGWVAVYYAPHGWWPVLGLIIGLSMSSIAFLAHDVTHRSVTTNPYLLYPTEVLLWALIFVPATLWRRVHGTHHAFTNSDQDPDRRYLESEIKSPTGMISAALMFPNRVLRYNIFCLMYWVLFPFRHLVVMYFFPGDKKPGFVTAKPRYSRAEKLAITFEIVFIVALQFTVYKFVHHGFWYTSVIPAVITSAVTSWYLFTNHGLKPVSDGHDILASSTTVTVPKFCDVLHSNFSYHTEHHLFPTMNPKYYPLVGELFVKLFPEQYHRIPMSEAWSGLWKNEIASPRDEEAKPARERRVRALSN